MKKDTIREHIIAALAVLLAFVGIVAVHGISLEYVYADGDTYAFDRVTAPTTSVEYDVENGKTEDQIKSLLNTNKKAVTISAVKTTTSGSTENVSIDDAAEITWGNITSIKKGTTTVSSYDPTDGSEYTLVWEGDVTASSGITKYSELSIPSNTKASITVKVARGDTYAFDRVTAPTTSVEYDVENGKTEDQIKSLLNTNKKAVTISAVKTTASGSTENVSIDDAAEITWGNITSIKKGTTTVSSYDPTDGSEYTLVWEGDVTASSGITKYRGLSIPSNTKASITVKVARGDTYAFDRVTTPTTAVVYNVENGKTEDQIKSLLNTNKKAVTISAVKTTASGSTENVSIGDAAEITWGNITSIKKGTTTVSSYDPTDGSEYTLVWEGDVTASSGITKYRGLSIPSNTKASITVKVATKVVYEKASVEDKEGFTAEIKADDVKEILDKQTGELGRIIEQAKKEGKKMSIKIEIESIDEDDADGSEKIKTKAENDKKGKVAKYYKITLKLLVAGEEKKPLITDAGKKITFKYSVDDLGLSSPDSKVTRKYKAFYYHDSSAHSIGEWKAASSGKYSFSADKFSTYGIAYADLDSNGNPISTSSASIPSNSAIVPGGAGDDAGGAAGGTDKSKTPKTGDNFDPRIWIYLLIVGATVASAAWILLQDTRDERKSNTGAKQ